MRIFTLSKLGRRVTKDYTGEGDSEMKILNFLRENHTATEDELEVVGGERWMLRRLEERGLIRELTNR